MSELRDGRRRRRRRADAERNIAAILDAAVHVLNARPEASIEDIAEAAGVTRPTVYAHFPSREALLNAAVNHVTEQALAAMDAADLDHGPPAAALMRFMEAGWQTFERYPLLLGASAQQTDPQAEHDRHQPVQERLERLIRRGQQAGDFDPSLSPTWLTTISIGLGHTAGEQVTAKNMTSDEAWTALQHTILRIFGVDNARRAGR
ncbi:MAG: TetR/AcrR family transcriptional regulator [Acidimicrobiales bacterium]